MYLEFRLPTGAGGLAAQHTYGALSRNLEKWSTRYNIPHVKKVHKYTVRVTFEDDKFYDFFALTWQPTASQMLSYLIDYRLIEPMNRV